MKAEQVSPRIRKYLKDNWLEAKFQKQLALLLQNPSDSNLNLELLEPKNRGIYSFRLDRNYRALFFYRLDHHSLEILAVTVHYH